MEASENQQIAEHSVRNSLLDRERRFSLGAAEIRWADQDATGTMALSQFASVELLTYPGNAARIGQCTIRNRDGGKIKFRSHSYVSLGNFEPRTETYSEFIRTICARVSALNQGAKFYAGHNGLKYAYVSILVLAIAIVPIILVGSVMKSDYVSGLPMLLGLSVLIPFLWRQVRRNKRVEFDPDNIPGNLIV